MCSLKQGAKRVGTQLSQRLLGPKSFALTGIPLPAVKMDEHVKWVIAREQYHWQLPLSLQEYRHPHFCISEPYYDDPSEGTLEIPNGIATRSGANLTASGAVVSTFLQALDGQSADKHSIYYFSAKRFFPRILDVKSAVMSLTDPWQGAFYHWMYQVLPRLGLMTRADAKIYADQSQLFQQQSIELLGLKDRLISTADYDAVRASTVISASFAPRPTCYNCQFLRQAFLPKTACYPQRRIYLSRNDARTRRLINEAELLPILEQFGFEKVQLAPLSFQEQIATLRSAQMVVAPHGAGLSHLVFCDPGTPVLEMFHKNYVNNCYWQLSSIQKLPYYMLFDTQPSLQEDPDFYIASEQLRHSLEVMERDWHCR